MMVQSALLLTCLIALPGGLALGLSYDLLFCVYTYQGTCYSGAVCPEDTQDLSPSSGTICVTGSICCGGTPSVCYTANGGNCAANGTCNTSTATCTCDAGFTGTLCDNDVCSPNPCENNGTCSSDGAGGYTCTCVDAGTKGTNCEILACDSPTDNQCTPANTDMCVPEIPTVDNKDDPYTCACNAGYYGDVCNRNYCDDGVCGLNSDGCTGSTSTPFYLCSCKIGFSGQQCENDICEGECNNQTCTRGNGVHTCTCDPGFTGVECDTPVTYTCGISTPTSRLLGGETGTGVANSTARVVLFGNITVGSAVFLHHAATPYKSAYMVFTTAEVCATCSTAPGNNNCSVIFGDDNLAVDESEQTIEVSEIIFKPAFNEQLSITDYFSMDPEDLKTNGVCALRLAEKIVPTGAITPVCGYTTEEYTDCYVAGYGVTNDTLLIGTDRNVLPVELVKSNCVCAQLRGKEVVDMATSIRCAVTCEAPETKGTCYHDYGGPVYCLGVDTMTYSLKGWVTMEQPFSNSTNCDKGTILWNDAADFTSWINSTFESVP